MSSNDVCAVDVEIKDTQGIDAQISEKEKIEAELQQISEGGGAGNPYAVLYVEQSLTEKQMAQARENIGAQPVGSYLESTELTSAIDTALAQAKASGEFDGNPGAPGVTPHIGTNGNWYIGTEDSGVSATGPAAQVTAANIQAALGYTPAATSQIPTDEHINDLINAALGVIENGTY